MVTLTTVKDIVNHLNSYKKQDKAIGFVPTMGALHEGHISLIHTAKHADQFVVCSIFVNPTQFNNPKDFEKYPITIEKDIQLLTDAGCDLLFLPDVTEMYPNGTKSSVHYDIGFIETILDGKYRPGHFQGVCQVVKRLLEIVSPHTLYLGQKDYQQCMVIKKLIEITGMQTKIVICPTKREADGLAMSSRNMRLTADERKKAVLISQSLLFIKNEIKTGYTDVLKERVTGFLNAEGFKVDYVEISDADTLNPVDYWNGKQPLVALVAAFLNEVRLIDNMLLTDN